MAQHATRWLNLSRHVSLLDVEREPVEALAKLHISEERRGPHLEHDGVVRIDHLDQAVGVVDERIFIRQALHVAVEIALAAAREALSQAAVETILERMRVHVPGSPVGENQHAFVEQLDAVLEATPSRIAAADSFRESPFYGAVARH